MQVVATVKRIRLRIRVRIEIDLRTQDADVRLAVCLVPATATSRNERLEARRQARESIGDDAAELAASGIGEAQAVFSIIIEDAEQRAQRACTNAQVATNAVDDHDCIVAIRTARNVRGRQHARHLVVTTEDTVECKRRRH